MKKFNLSSDIILNKKFPTELSGYNAAEVDKYLDLVLEDYRTYEEAIKLVESKLEEKATIISEKDDEIQRLRLEIQNLKTQLRESAKASNFELNKKIDAIASMMATQKK